DLVFFFQAEDGIRDFHVTGVQTCALPISIEEAYEVVESIDNKDYQELRNELGDLLLHVVFHTIIAEEENHFTLQDVIDSIQSKLIRRHPHVFGTTEVSGSEEVKKNWEAIKLSEGRTAILEGVPRRSPALQRAYRLQEKAAKVGFDWENIGDEWDKALEEIEGMHEAKRESERATPKKISNAEYEQLEEEVGDVFFALVNYARFLHINPENALRKT